MSRTRIRLAALARRRPARHHGRRPCVRLYGQHGPGPERQLRDHGRAWHPGRPLRLRDATRRAATYRLDKVRVRAPRTSTTTRLPRTGSAGATSSSATPNFVGAFNEVYRSPIYKSKANDNTSPAQFSDRTWTAPEPFSKLKGNWKVWVVLFWFKPGSSTAVKSKHVLELDYYAVRGGGTDTRTAWTAATASTRRRSAGATAGIPGHPRPGRALTRPGRSMSRAG